MLAPERLPFFRSATLPLAGDGSTLMDINYMLAREQIELMLARAATHAGARAAHQGMADRYRNCVDDHRRALTISALRAA